MMEINLYARKQRLAGVVAIAVEAGCHFRRDTISYPCQIKSYASKRLATATKLAFLPVQLEAKIVSME